MRLHAFSGHLHESRRAALDLHRLASGRGYWSHLSWVNYQLGAIAYELNDLDAALEHFSAVVTTPHLAHSAPLRESVFGLARTQRARGLEAEARLAFTRHQEFLQQSANLEQLALVRSLEDLFFADAGTIVAAPAQSNDRAPRQASMLGMTGNPDVLRIQALLQQATGAALAEAAALLQALLSHARAAHFIAREIELLALQSLLAQIRGDGAAAAETLDYALDLAAPGGFMRTFLDRGAPLAEVLKTLRPRSSHRAYIDRLLAAFAAERSGRAGRSAPEAPPSVAPAGAAIPLTEREIEILARLADRLSYKEIAGTLGISPFTVKAHVSNIYGKLGASGRRDALASARAFGLIAGA
jgi:LuxR family maltose regulon positive regulatory protein